MTHTSIAPKRPHPMMPGQAVCIRRGARLPNAARGTYKILNELPEHNGERRYRIKSDDESYTRSVWERDIEQIISHTDRDLSEHSLLMQGWLEASGLRAPK
jgi:hypothetical protein